MSKHVKPMVSSGEEPEIDREFLEAQAERDAQRLRQRNKTPAQLEKDELVLAHEERVRNNYHMRPSVWNDGGHEHDKLLQSLHPSERNKLFPYTPKHDSEDEYESPKTKPKSKPRESFCTKLSRKLGLCGGTRKRRSKRSRK